MEAIDQCLHSARAVRERAILTSFRCNLSNVWPRTTESFLNSAKNQTALNARRPADKRILAKTSIRDFESGGQAGVSWVTLLAAMSCTPVSGFVNLLCIVRTAIDVVLSTSLKRYSTVQYRPEVRTIAWGLWSRLRAKHSVGLVR